MYIGQYGEKLIDIDFVASEYGGVAPEIQENYAALIGTQRMTENSLNDDEKDFLRGVFLMLKDAPIAELVSIACEDPSWHEKANCKSQPDCRMNSLKYREEYRNRYEAANYYLKTICQREN